MSTDINNDVIKSTQESLGKFVKKPALSDKLLKKPPFRFLHDVVTAVKKSTGFFEGLFTDEELVSDNVKDRESKIAFLQKVIEVVNIVTDSSLTVRPSKIIAGLEPEKTNELLQKLGLALQQNLSSKQAIEIVNSSKISKKTANTTTDTHETNEKPKKTVEKIKKPTKKDEDSKLAKNHKSEISNKTKTNLSIPERKKEKAKTDSVAVNEKTNLKNKKTDISKKAKGPDHISKIKNEKESTNKKNNIIVKTESLKNASIDLDTENDLSGNEAFGKVVQLKYIIDHLDDANSISQDMNTTESSQPKPLIIDEQPIVPEKPIVQEDVSPNEAPKLAKDPQVIRPQSRVTRQRSSIASYRDEKKPEADNKAADLSQNKSDTSTLEESLPNDVNQKNTQSLENKIDPVPQGQSSLNELRESSSKRSAKIKPELLKSAQSLSIESKSETETQDQKSVTSGSDIKDKPPPPKTLRPPSVRPSSARPGAPRLRERNTDVIVTTAEPVIVGKVHVIVENYDNQQEDDEGSVEVLQVTTDENITNLESADTKPEGIASGHGHLVQQILETQKELAHEDNSKIEIEWEYGARREREASYKEIEGIRSGLQSLSRASNPLGKLMDYIQEDVEVMKQELLQWREARLTASAELKHQESLTENQIQPLQAKLKQLEDSILEQTELIYTVKSNIYRNAQRILKLVDGDD